MRHGRLVGRGESVGVELLGAYPLVRPDGEALERLASEAELGDDRLSRARIDFDSSIYRRITLWVPDVVGQSQPPESAVGLDEGLARLLVNGTADTPSPEESAKLADTVLKRVAEQVGHAATRSNVLRNLATVVVEADSDFVRSLIDQPEVISAIPNETVESPYIPPKRKRPV